MHNMYDYEKKTTGKKLLRKSAVGLNGVAVVYLF